MSSPTPEGLAWLLGLARWSAGRSRAPLPSPRPRRPPPLRTSGAIGTRDEIAGRYLTVPCRKLAAVLASKRLPRWGGDEVLCPGPARGLRGRAQRAGGWWAPAGPAGVAAGARRRGCLAGPADRGAVGRESAAGRITEPRRLPVTDAKGVPRGGRGRRTGDPRP